MKAHLVLDGWYRQNGSKVAVGGERWMQLTEGILHSGTTFMAEISLSDEQERELKDELAAGYYPAVIVRDLT